MLVALSAPVATRAATLVDLQAQLQTLMAQITAMQSGSLQQATGTSVATCPNLTRNLARGMRGDDVRQLQQFLISEGSLTVGNATGFYGPLTEAAAKKFQCKRMNIWTGSPSSNGYGAVGPRTRAAIAAVCKSADAPTPPTNTPKPTPAPNPVPTPPIVPTPQLETQATVCTAFTAFNGSSSDASGTLQACIDAASSGTILELPPGKYTIAHQIKIRKPLTFRTEGKTQSMPRCQFDDTGCAEIIAPSALNERWGMMTIDSSSVFFDHIILNGNRAARLDSVSGNAAKVGDNNYGHNLMVFSCSNCQITNSVFKKWGIPFTGLTSRIYPDCVVLR